MPRNDVRRSVAVVLLVACVFTPTLSWSAERRSEGRGEITIPTGRLLPAFWNLLRSMWAEEGGSLDPSGQPRSDEGSSLDPDGLKADEGSDIDPDG